MDVALAPGRAKNAARSELDRRLHELNFRKSAAPDAWVCPLDEGGVRGCFAVQIDFYPIARLAYLWDKNEVTKSVTVRTDAGVVPNDDPYIGNQLVTVLPTLSDFLGELREQFISDSIAAIVREYRASEIPFDGETASLIREMHHSDFAVPFALLSEGDVRRWADLIMYAIRTCYADARARML